MDRRCFAIALLTALAPGCSGPPRPFERGQRIDLGEYTVTVNSGELSEVGGRRVLVAYFRCDQTEGTEQVENFERYFLTAFHLRDGNGKKYRGVPLPAIITRHMNFRVTDSISADEAADLLQQGGLGDPHEWGVLFNVPPDASRFTLHIANPDRRSGQPSSASIDLGR